MADRKEPARSGFEKCGPYHGLLPRASAGEGEGRGGGASCELDELQPWRLWSSAVAASTMANGGRWSYGCDWMGTGWSEQSG